MAITQPISKNHLIVALLGGLSILLLYTCPLAVNHGLDFSQFYIDLFGILRGDAIYNEYAHATHYVQSGAAARVVLNPPAYPPWYYAFFLPLGVFDIHSSAVLWAWLNLAMLFTAVTLLTSSLSPTRRFALMALCLLFAPVVGHLVVGQQTMILLLGSALVLRGIERGSSPLSANGLLLLSFKPHLGLPIAAAVIFWLLLRHSPLAVSTLIRFTLGMIGLMIISLILDRHALIDYPESLRRLSALSLNQDCDTCSSLSLAIQSSFPSFEGHIWAGRFLLSIGIGSVLVLPLFLRTMTTRIFISGIISAVLLAAPYIRNYDYVLLLGPIVAISEQALRQSREQIRFKWLRTFLCFLAFLSAGILPLMLERETHQSFFWISAALTYLATLLPDQRATA